MYTLISLSGMLLTSVHKCVIYISFTQQRTPTHAAVASKLRADCSQAHLFLLETVASLVLLGLGRLIFLPDHYLEMLVRNCPCLYIIYAGNCLRYMANQATCIVYDKSGPD